MPRNPSFPKYPSKAHRSGQARIRFRGRDYYLGVHGSDASRQEYARLAKEFASNPHRTLPTKPPTSAVTIAELVVLWHEGAPKTNETEQVLGAAKPLIRRYGDFPAAEFDAEMLESLREELITCSWMNAEELAERAKRKKLPGWSRNHVNHQINRIRRIFRWAERKKKVPRGTWEHLRTLPRLGKDSAARKNPKRRPVEDADVEKTLPYLSLMVAAMVRVQVAAGMRPSELVKMRAKDVNQSGEVWTYRLDEFKTDHLDDADDWQTVMLGPDAMASLMPWLDAAAVIGPDTFIWRPKPGVPDNLGTDGYYQAVVDGCARAGVKRWCPYQLRHSFRRKVTRIFGSDGARAAMRHRTLQSTQQYASQQDLETAAEVAKKCG